MSAGLFILTRCDGKIHCTRQSFPVMYDYDKRLHTIILHIPDLGSLRIALDSPFLLNETITQTVLSRLSAEVN